MSKLVDKLKGLATKPHVVAVDPADVNKELLSQPRALSEAPASKKGHFFIFLTLGIIAALIAGYYLGIMSANVAISKNKVLSNMDANIQKQQDQISMLDQKLDAMQASVNDRINSSDDAAKDLNKNMDAKLSDLNSNLQEKIDDLNNNVKTQIDQATSNENQMNTVMQGKMDDLTTKVNKLQADLLSATTASDQTNAVTTN